ncbi:MAG TPA: glycosyltransferase family 2 protein [Chitinophagales bacterium]|nr:glycosyltransferase family 2 protein [Chitinophagales bacterium]
MAIPAVTVLMPVYNAEKFLAEAIESVLNQTFLDFELLIINDGSTDGSRKIIQSYHDGRIRLVDNAANMRLIATLNKGIELAQGSYIARMDADDVCLPQRLEKQVAFMNAHPEVGLCGCYLRTLGHAQEYDIRFETEHDAITFKLFFDTHFPHPAAMLRRSVLLQYQLRFDKDYIHAEDFEMWNRMADVCRLAIIPEVLMLKRMHGQQISSVHAATQDKISRRIRMELMQKMGLCPGSGEMDVYEDFLKGKMPVERHDLELLLDLFEKLVVANNSAGRYKPELFNRFFAEKYWQLCTTSTHLGLWVFRKYRNSVFHKNKMVAKEKQGRFFAKSLLRYSYKN